jgi:hypothetical protein
MDEISTKECNPDKGGNILAGKWRKAWDVLRNWSW